MNRLSPCDGSECGFAQIRWNCILIHENWASRRFNKNTLMFLLKRRSVLLETFKCYFESYIYEYSFIFHLLMKKTFHKRKDFVYLRFH